MMIEEYVRNEKKGPRFQVLVYGKNVGDLFILLLKIYDDGG
jgi:hypothetical protein